jgi:predicted transcriptional regulator
LTRQSIDTERRAKARRFYLPAFASSTAIELARYHFTVGKPRRRCDQTSILRGRIRRE